MYQCIEGQYGRIQVKGYAVRDPMEPIAYKRYRNKAPHVPRNWAKLYAEQARFSITLGDGDWLHDRRPVTWVYKDQKDGYDLVCAMTPHKDPQGDIFGPPSDDESMADEEEPIDRPVASLRLRPDRLELDTGRCVNLFNGALIKPPWQKSQIGQESFYVFTHIMPSVILPGAAKRHMKCETSLQSRKRGITVVYIPCKPSSKAEKF